MCLEQFRWGIKTGLFTLFLSFSLSSYSQSHTETNSYFNHLSEINIEWLQYKEICPKGTASFDSDPERIQLHLNLVIEHLKSNNLASLNAKQLANRFYLLSGLQEYADKKIFPVNKYHTNRQPYFVDDFGTNCAVGQMISLSGHKDLVTQISKEHNYDYLKNIKTDGITEWANEHGFTLAELEWIQPGYPPSTSIEQVLAGTNGSVNKIEYNVFTGSLTITGEFTKLNDLPCLNIGAYFNNQLYCLGDGVDGMIHDVIHQSGEIYAFGELNYNGEIFPAAVFDGVVWNYIKIPDRDGASCTAANTGGLGYQFEMAISHSSIPNHQEIWHFLNNNTWERKAKVKGVIRDIIASSYGRVHVGHLDSVTVYTSNNTVDTMLMVNNVLIQTNYSEKWYGIGDEISDTVNVVKNIGGALIFGGTCINQSGASKVCISRYFNSSLQPLYLNHSSVKEFSINTIAYNFGNKFAFGGDFQIFPVIGTYGSNLATYDLVYNTVEPIAEFDKRVNSVSYLKNELFIGGRFQTNQVTQRINFLGREASPVSTQDLLLEEAFDIYPNPFTTSLHLKGVENGVDYSILSMNGRTLKSGTVLEERIENLDELSSGIFLLRLESSKGMIVKKIIK